MVITLTFRPYKEHNLGFLESFAIYGMACFAFGNPYLFGKGGDTIGSADRFGTSRRFVPIFLPCFLDFIVHARWLCTHAG